MSELFKTERQADGQWKATLLDGGFIQSISGCESEQAAINNATYALAKNREYKEQGAD